MRAPRFALLLVLATFSMATVRPVQAQTATSTLTRLVLVWHREGGEWRLTRVLSLDHHAVPATTGR